MFEMFFRRSGRLNRLRYFKCSMVVFLIAMIVELPVAIIFSDDSFNLSSFGNMLVMIINLVAQIPLYCLDVRRLHDMDKDETLAKILLIIGVIVAIVPVDDLYYAPPPMIVVYLVGTVLGLYVLFTPGTKGENKYGADPLDN